MSQITKTLIFAGVALVFVGAAYISRPAPFDQPVQQSGERLFEEITSATQAESLEIVNFDKETDGEVRLRVARKNGDWVITSHNDYPADASDATDRIRDVALAMMEMKVIKLATTVTSDHADFGVVAPNGDAAEEVETKDIGTLVSLSDAGGRRLAELIIGKPVQGAPGQRFVRKANQPEVYTAEFDISKLSTKFSQWIEEDLLGINAWDIRRVVLKDYSILKRRGRLPDGTMVEQPVGVDDRLQVDVTWDDEKSEWNLNELLEARQGRLAPSTLSEDEELNATALNELKDAIGELKIVDVDNKPEELVAGIKSEDDLLKDEKILPSLIEKGFIPSPGGDEIVSDNGEVLITGEDGIQYLLRFGRTAGIEEEGEEAKLNRYLLVTARIDETFFAEQPDTTPPQDEATAPAADEGASGQTGEEGNGGDEGATNEETPSTDDAVTEDAVVDEATEEVPSEPADDEADSPETSATEGVEEEPAADEPTVTDESETETAETDEPTTDNAAPETTEEPAGPSLTPPAAVDVPDADAGGEGAADEMATKRKEAEAKVAELNQKFGRWYYVIPEDVYKKIHLGRFDIVKEKEGTLGPDALQPLGPRQPGGGGLPGLPGAP